MADRRSYSAGRCFLSLDTDQSGAPLVAVAGGVIRAQVVALDQGPGSIQKKQLAGIAYEPFAVGADLSMGAGLADWLTSSVLRAAPSRSGRVILADANSRAIAVRRFRDAVITEVTFPALDAASKASARFTIRFDPEEITYQAGDASPLKTALGVKPKKWLASSFRFELGSLPCGRVSKIDAFTWKQTVTRDWVGHGRLPSAEPGKIEIPNLVVTFSSADLQSWAAWFEDFVIDGRNSDDQELSGRIVWLGSDRREELGAIELQHVGIVSLDTETPRATGDRVARSVAELYVEEMKLSLKLG